MEESMRKKLATGFLLFKLGLGLLWGMLFVVLSWIAGMIISGTTDFKMIGVIIGMFFVGIIVLFVGRAMVGLQGRKLNFMTDRPRTEEEDWLLHELLENEDKAVRINFANRVGAVTPGKLDDFVTASMATGIIRHFNALGKLYITKNFLVKNCTLILSLVLAVVLLLVKVI